MDQERFDLLPQQAAPQGNIAPNFPLRKGPSELSDVLAARGQIALLKGDLQEGLRCFEEATALDPHNAHLHYAQGLALFDFGEKTKQQKILVQASKKFKRATALNTDFLQAWQAWASLLRKLGTSDEKQHYFQEAHEKILRAIALSGAEQPDVVASLYWDLGAISVHLAHYSGEAVDLHQALRAFYQAHALQKQLPAAFWQEYGRACFAFALKINETRFYGKAISCLKNALALEPHSWEYWHFLANIFDALYMRTQDEDHFSQANDCYGAATQLQPGTASLWLDWAKFLCICARSTYETKQLCSCIEKCERAHRIDPDNLLLQGIWAEALAMLGCETEQLAMLDNALDRIEAAIEIKDDLPELWYACGMVLIAFSRYFNDNDYAYQAIEKFQEGLSIDRSCHAHWHAIGQLYILLGEVEHEQDTLRRAFRFLRRAIVLFPCSSYIIDYAIALSKWGEAVRKEEYLEEAIVQFERAIALQKNALYTHPDWLFHYAACLDALGDFHEEDIHYLRAIEIFSHVLMVEPDFYPAHHRFALTLSHLGELTENSEHFHRAIHHLRLCAKHDPENDIILLDWGILLMHVAYYSREAAEADNSYRDAEHKLWQVIRLGNPQAYYQLACLYSLTDQCEKAMLCLRRGAHFDVLPPIDEMLQDEWLDELRATGECIAFFSALET